MKRRIDLSIVCAASVGLFLVMLAGSHPAAGQGTSPTQTPRTPNPLTRFRVGLALPREVAVIAPNYYAREVADDILKQKHVTETTLKHADAILVVLRSTLLNPLRTSYTCPCDLRRETSARAGFAGQKVHVYVFAVDDNLRVRRIAHDIRATASPAAGAPAMPPLYGAPKTQEPGGVR